MAQCNCDIPLLPHISIRRPSQLATRHPHHTSCTIDTSRALSSPRFSASLPHSCQIRGESHDSPPLTCHNDEQRVTNGIDQTLYIFFGVAALVGIVAGLILHLSSNFIIQLLHLDKIQEEEQTEGYTAATYRAARQKKKQEEKLQKAAQRRLLATHPAVVDGASLKREYADWLEQDHGRRKDGLLSTTILEEEDDSETGF